MPNQLTFWDTATEPNKPLQGLRLRPYQAEAVDGIQVAFDSADTALVEMPTGSGKTEVFVQLMQNRASEGRALVICPMITLIEQAARKIEMRTGTMPGIEQASRWSNETPWGRSPFIVASKASLTSAMRDGQPRYTRFRDVSLVIVDEAHLSITPQYKAMIDFFLNQGSKVVGVTATAKRHDKMAMGNVYQTVAYQDGIEQAMNDGWLVPSRGLRVQVQSLDLKDVSTQRTAHYGTDFSASQLNAALESVETVVEIADITAKETAGLKTVVYCSSVEEARMVSERLRGRHGINSAWICADTSKCSPQHRIHALKSFVHDRGGVTHLCNVGILTTGWDFPGLQAIVQARPTQSLSLYTQIFGRGTRPLPGVVDFPGSTPELRKARISKSGKPDFLMVDLVDTTVQHKIRSSTDVLGGRFDLDVLDLARDILARNSKEGRGMLPAEALMQAEIEAERLRKEEREREEEARRQAERERLSRIEADTYYNTESVDLFGDTHGSIKRRYRAPRMIFGKYKGRPLCEVPGGYLRWAVANTRLPAWLKGAIKNELSSRNGGTH